MNSEFRVLENRVTSLGIVSKLKTLKNNLIRIRGYQSYDNHDYYKKTYEGNGIKLSISLSTLASPSITFDFVTIDSLEQLFRGIVPNIDELIAQDDSFEIDQRKLLIDFDSTTKRAKIRANLFDLIEDNDLIDIVSKLIRASGLSIEDELDNQLKRIVEKSEEIISTLERESYLIMDIYKDLASLLELEKQQINVPASEEELFVESLKPLYERNDSKLLLDSVRIIVKAIENTNKKEIDLFQDGSLRITVEDMLSKSFWKDTFPILFKLMSDKVVLLRNTHISEKISYDKGNAGSDIYTDQQTLYLPYKKSVSKPTQLISMMALPNHPFYLQGSASAVSSTLQDRIQVQLDYKLLRDRSVFFISDKDDPGANLQYEDMVISPRAAMIEFCIRHIVKCLSQEDQDGSSMWGYGYIEVNTLGGVGKEAILQVDHS